MRKLSLRNIVIILLIVSFVVFSVYMLINMNSHIYLN